MTSLLIHVHTLRINLSFLFIYFLLKNQNEHINVIKHISKSETCWDAPVRKINPNPSNDAPVTTGLIHVWQV